MKISQLINNRGNAANNQFIITTDKGNYFQSYDTIVAFEDHDGNVVFSTAWNYSAATLKHLKIFLNTNKSKKQLENMIESGIIRTVENLEII